LTPTLRLVPIFLVFHATAALGGVAEFIDASADLDGVIIQSFRHNGAGYHGAAALDFDGDGHLDLYLGNGPTQNNAMLRNDGTGRFEEVGVFAGAVVNTGTGGVLAADLDNDGLPELVLAGDRSSLRTLRNMGGYFEDQTLQSGLRGEFRSVSAHAADVDGDGLLDVWLAGGIVPKQTYYNTLYMNNADGTFRETGEAAGLRTNVGACAATWTHLDTDPYIDLVVANCNTRVGVQMPYEVYRNNGDGTFADIYVESRIWAVGHFMSMAMLDYDGDGLLDFFSANGGIDRKQPHALYRNNGDGTWSDKASEAQVADHFFGWGSVAADFDNDGWVDLFWVGTPHATAEGHPGYLFMNNGDGTFAGPTVPFDMSHLWSSGLTQGDFDSDGFVDLVVAVTEGMEGEPGTPIYLRNVGNDNHWLTVQLQGTTSNRQGIGAQIRAVVGDRHHLREVSAGTSYLSTVSPWPTIGLAAHTEAWVCVRWPDGVGEDFGTFAADQKVHLVQGSGLGPVPCEAPTPPPTGDTGPVDTAAPTTSTTPTETTIATETTTTSPTETTDSAVPDDGAAPTKGKGGAPSGCGCASAPPSASLWWLLFALVACGTGRNKDRGGDSGTGGSPTEATTPTTGPSTTPTPTTTTAPTPTTTSTATTAPTTPTSCLRAELEVVAGTGISAYLELQDGDPVEMEHGPQGGWHITTAAHIEGVSPLAKLTPLVLRASGDWLAGYQPGEYRELDDYDPDTCAVDATDIRAWMKTRSQEFICSLEGEMLTLSVEVLDLETKASGVGSVQVIATLDPDDVEVCK
jgi:enediyne biosynthesis protein E4